MTAHEDAVKAAAEALSEYYEGDGWGYFGAAAEAAVAAAAPILLADAQTVFETLTVTSKARQEQVERLIAEVARWKALVDAKQSWIDGAKVDLAAAEAAVAFVATLPHDYTAADVYAAMTGLNGGDETDAGAVQPEVSCRASGAAPASDPDPADEGRRVFRFAASEVRIKQRLLAGGVQPAEAALADLHALFSAGARGLFDGGAA